MDTKLMAAAKLALEMEKTGYALYLKTARETDQPLVYSTFAGLAERELDHIKRIETLYAAVSKAAIDYQQIQAVSVAIDKRQILALILAKHRERLEKRNRAGITDVFKLALPLEKESHDYYRKLADESGERRLKTFFALLADEENEHYLILQDALVYLDKPEEWIWAKEHWIEEG